MMKTTEAIASIQRQAARDLGMSMEDLVGCCRSGPLVQARHAAIYRCWRDTDATLFELGRAFRRDYTTVGYVVAKMGGAK